MDQLLFDTHRAIKRLMSVGFTEEQAEEQTSIYVEIINDNLATKKDIENIHLEFEKVHQEFEKVHQEFEKVRQESAQEFEKVRHEFEKTRSQTKADIKNSQYDILKWIISLFVIQFTAITGLFFKLMSG